MTKGHEKYVILALLTFLGTLLVGRHAVFTFGRLGRSKPL